MSMSCGDRPANGLRMLSQYCRATSIRRVVKQPMNLSRVASTIAVVPLILLGRTPPVARGAGVPVTVIGDVTVISAERATPLEHAYVRIANGQIADVSTHPL